MSNTPGISTHIRNPGAVPDRRVAAAIELMAKDYSAALDLTGLAAAVNLSASRLAHLFKQQMGLAPRRYFKLIRMRQAKDLLENSFLSVKEIRAKTGLTDHSHFSRDFARMFGASPTSLRKRRGWRPSGNGSQIAVAATRNKFLSGNNRARN